MGNKSSVEQMKNPYNISFSIHLIHSLTRQLDAACSSGMWEYWTTINSRNAKEYHYFNMRVIASCESGKNFRLYNMREIWLLKDY
jgi:hypothetical protein